MKTPPKNARPKVALPRLVLPGPATWCYEVPRMDWGVLCYVKKRMKVTVHHVVGEFAMVQRRGDKPFIAATKHLRQSRQNDQAETRPSASNEPRPLRTP